MTRPHVFTMTPHEHVSRSRSYTGAVRAVSREWVGKGEAPGSNNRGVDVDELRAISGVGRIGGAGSWCAVFASAMLVLGASVDIRVPCALSAGAKRLVNNLGDERGFIVSPIAWRPWGGVYRGPARGMEHALLIAWHRGHNPRQRWQGHVEVVIAYSPSTDTLTTVAGNVVPGQTARAELLRLGLVPHDGQALVHVRTYPDGAWRKRLYAVAVA